MMWHWQIKVDPGVVMSDRYMQCAILKGVFCESAKLILPRLFCLCVLLGRWTDLVSPA